MFVFNNVKNYSIMTYFLVKSAFSSLSGINDTHVIVFVFSASITNQVKGAIHQKIKIMSFCTPIIKNVN